MVWLYPTVKNYEDTFISFDRVYERDGRTPHDGICKHHAAKIGAGARPVWRVRRNVVAVCVCEDARRTMSLLSRRVMSVEHLRGLAGRLTTIERALHQLTYNALATSTY